jgi:hypothetical protein
VKIFSQKSGDFCVSRVREIAGLYGYKISEIATGKFFAEPQGFGRAPGGVLEIRRFSKVCGDGNWSPGVGERAKAMEVCRRSCRIIISSKIP